jgi:hypothetical protein
MGVITPDPDCGGRGIQPRPPNEIFTKLTDQLSFTGFWIENHLDEFIQKLR